MRGESVKTGRTRACMQSMPDAFHAGKDFENGYTSVWPEVRSIDKCECVCVCGGAWNKHNTYVHTF